jgi:hypothetical protein
MNIDFRNLLTPRVLLGALGVAVVLLVLMFTWVVWSAPPPPNAASVAAVVTLIPAPSATASPQPTATPNPELTPTPPAGQVSVGAYVQISGTEGQGLRLRSTPGLEGEFLFLGYDSEVFIVQDGPRELDGYTWWYLVSNYDEKRAGWAAANFLTYVPAP